MNTRDELLRAVQQGMSDISNWPDDVGYKLLGVNMSKPQNAVTDAILAAGYTRPRTVSTVEELDALRTDSTIRSAQGGIWFKEASGKGCVWTEPGAQWWHWPTDIALPATVLYEATR